MFGQNLISNLNAYDRLADLWGSQINGQVRTGYKQTTPRVDGSGDAGPYDPESGISLRTTLDLSQGTLVRATDPNQLAIQGQGFFLLTSTSNLDANGQVAAGAEFLLSRDGDFHLDAQGRLVNANGLALVTPGPAGDLSGGSAVYGQDATAVPPGAIRLDVFLANAGGTSLANVTRPQALQFTNYGSTVFDPSQAGLRAGTLADQATVLSGSLEASNSSTTTAMPMMAQAQKMFAATTKVMTIHQNNTDALLAVIK